MNRADIPAWIERLLGLGARADGEGTVWTLEHSWGWAPWLSVVAVALLVAAVVYNYAREAGEAGPRFRALLIGLRLGALGVVLFMLAQFVLSLERTGLPHVALVIDDSRSMGVEDLASDEAASSAGRPSDEPASRFEHARRALLADRAAAIRGIADRFKLRVYLAASGARPLEGSFDEVLAAIDAAQPEGDSSQLGDALRSVLNDLRGAPPAAVVLISDGIVTGGESLVAAAAYARRKGVPLYTVGVGSDQPLRDLRLHDLLVDDVVFVGDTVNFEMKLTASGYAGQEVEVALARKDRPGTLARTTVLAGADGEAQNVRLTFRPEEIGQFEFVAEAALRPDEAQPQNNRQGRLITVRKEQIRVLLVQAYPNYEFRYLKQMLDRDGTIQLQTVLQSADPEYVESDRTALPVFPVRREALYEYDVVIFGDVDPAFLSRSMLDDLHAFVTQKGGGLVVIAGPRFTPASYAHSPLASLLPIDPTGGTPEPLRSIDEGFTIQPTELGLATPFFQLADGSLPPAEVWRGLPPVYWLFEAARLKPGAQVLAVHPTRLLSDGQPLPVIALHYAGAGKVLFHASDETWRWRLQVGDVYFARYWVQAIRYLSRAKLLGDDRSAELVADRREYRRGDPVRLRVRFTDERLAPASDDGVTVVVEQDGRPKRRVKLVRNPGYRGVFEGELGQATEGTYHVWMADPTVEGRAASTDFSVVAPPGELEHTQADWAELRRAAELARGSFSTLDELAALGDILPVGRQVPIESLPPLVLWNQWPLMLLFVSLLVSEWLLRKLKGMV